MTLPVADVCLVTSDKETPFVRALLARDAHSEMPSKKERNASERASDKENIRGEKEGDV